MKYTIKLMLSTISFVLFFTSASVAEKKLVPIVVDDLLSFASYNTTTNNLQVPILSNQNEYKELLVQCEDDVTYFLMAHMYYDRSEVTVDNGNIVIDEHFNQDNVAYVKGHIEGNGSIAITGKVYFGDTLYGEETKTCRSNVTSVNTLEVPTFNGNSQGKLVIQCEDDIVYYIMAYACLRQDTNPSVSTNNGIAVTDEKRHEGIIFYVKGHVERTGGPVTITGHVYSGGRDLYIWPSWIQTCP